MGYPVRPLPFLHPNPGREENNSKIEGEELLTLDPSDGRTQNFRFILGPRILGQILWHQAQLLTWAKVESGWENSSNKHFQVKHKTMLTEILIGVAGAVL